MRTPGRGRSYLVAGTPRLQPSCACRGGMEDTRQAARLGCGRSAHAGAGGRTLGRQHAPAVAVLRTPGREEGHLAGHKPWLWLSCARRGREEAT